jgi:hypothetical protein
MRTYEQAQAFAEKQRLSNRAIWFNLCQKFSRSCVGAGGWAPSARKAFNAVPAKWRSTSFPPPPGSIAYYGSATHGNGHAVFVSGKPGFVYSNDIKRRGKIDLVPWNVFGSAWGMPYRGYITHTPNGTPLPIKPHATPVKPKPANTIIPTVSVARLIKAAKADIPAATGHKTYPAEVLIVEKALNRAGLLASKFVDGSFGTTTRDAYGDWQRHLGYSGADANGVPGLVSLTALGKKYGFRVAA